MKHFLYSILLVLLLVFPSCNKSVSSHDNEITVYCYDSFLGSWGAGEKIAKEFEKETDIHVNLVGCGGASELYGKILYEGSSCKADAVVGLSDSVEVDTKIFSSLIPYDYGVFAFVFDSESPVIQPTSLEDLTKDIYRDKVILIDPRTSSVGLGLLKWTVQALGRENAMNWWSEMAENCLTISSSWSSAYGIFTEGEAPLVISYTTSPVYHLMYENSDRFQALEFSNGHIKTVEYAGVLETSTHKDAANRFLDYLANQAQPDLAVANTMFPANEKTILPKEFEAVPKVRLLESPKAEEDIDSLIREWTEAVTK